MATQTKPATATGTLVDQLVDDQPAVTVPDASVDVATANKGVRESEQEQERTTRLDGQIRSTAGALDGGTVYLRQLIAKAKDTKENPHFLSLVGFKSWTDYIIDVMQAMA